MHGHDVEVACCKPEPLAKSCSPSRSSAPLLLHDERAGSNSNKRFCYLQPRAPLPRRTEVLLPLQQLILPKRWGRDVMQAAIQAAFGALQVCKSVRLAGILE